MDYAYEQMTTTLEIGDLQNVWEQN